jgi:signal transduction histidine kinase
MKNLIKILLLFLAINSLYSQNYNLDSIENLDPEDRYYAYQKFYRSILLKDSALCREYIVKSINLAKKLENKELVGESYGALGYFYDYNMNYLEAIQYYTIQIGIMEDMDTLTSRSPHNNLGIVYKDLGEYEKSLYHLEKAAKISAIKGNTEDEINTKNNIANVYSSWGKIDKATEILRECLTLALKDSIRTSTAFSMANLGSQFQSNEQYDSTLYYYKQAFNYFRLDEEPNHVLELHSSISNIYMELNKLDSAKYHLEQAERLLKDYGNFNNEAENKLYLSKYYFKSNDYDKAIQTINVALPKIEELRVISLLTKYYNLAKDIYEVKGDYKSSNLYLKKLLAIKDSINAQNYEKSLAAYEVRMNIAEKEKENELLMAKHEKTDLQNKYLIAVIIFIVISIIIVLFRYYEINNIKKLLQENNQKLKDINEKLVESERDLQELNATKDKFFSIIAHDLKNPIGTFKNLTDLLHKEYESFDDEERKDFIRMLNDSGESLSLLLENLLTWSRSQRGKILFNPVDIDLRDLAQKNIDVLQLNASQKNIELVNDIDENLIIKADPNMLTTIFRNITGNSIKFTPDGGKVSIKAVQNGSEKISIKITDTGVGMPQEKIENLFKIDKNISTEGTNNEKGTGLGLIIVNEFINKHNGEIKVESKIGVGSTFEILLPKN